MYVTSIVCTTPKNGNPGIIPPWLLDSPVHILPFPGPGPLVPPIRTEVIGTETPSDPHIPVIM